MAVLLRHCSGKVARQHIADDVAHMLHVRHVNAIVTCVGSLHLGHHTLARQGSQRHSASLSNDMLCTPMQRCILGTHRVYDIYVRGTLSARRKAAQQCDLSHWHVVCDFSYTDSRDMPHTWTPSVLTVAAWTTMAYTSSPTGTVSCSPTCCAWRCRRWRRSWTSHGQMNSRQLTPNLAAMALSNVSAICRGACRASAQARAVRRLA